MIRREGRLAHPEHEAETHSRAAGHTVRTLHMWEGPVAVLALIAILILGGIASLNALIALFPH